ncbi:peptidase M48, Ste24p [Xenorhabdus sp. 12]|uniref:Peptidase M48, Ste24p n=1 Tax=Xenorhabdus santafensis TaxID=2582833 RepID=A0ABU4S7D0_9GAMM|nr:M48 family metalloprotease [Xenorhabdus sp. 12]MDX7986315.1 peptidase M48, Ste24p [Xenorhabdus sp. 12]
MRNKLFLWLLVLPLVLSCYGGWQYSRISGLNEALNDIKSLHNEASQQLRNNPHATMEINGQSFTIEEIYYRTTSILDSDKATFNTFQSLLDLGTMGGGILSLLLGGFAILLCIRSGITARQSRDQLLKVFNRCRRLLPFILIAQMTLIGVSLFSLICYEILWFISNFEIKSGGAKIIFIAGSAALAILWCIIKGIAKLKYCFAMFEPSLSHYEGKAVTPEDAPGLWHWINELAEQVGTEPPDNIIVGLTECFFVTSSPVCISNEQVLEGQTLYFPLIYGALLSREESAAVIGHELGHFTGEDTTYSLHFSPIYSGMNRSIDVMISNVQDAGDYYARLVMSPSIYLGIFFIQQFDFAVNHWSRLREHAADAVGASLSSVQSISTSLLRISAVSEEINKQLSALFEGKLKTDDLLPVITDNLRENGVPESGQFLENEFTHPTDTHPTTKARIEALGQPVDQDLLEHASRTVDAGYYDNINSLFSDAKALSTELTQHLSNEIDEYYQEQTQVWEEQVKATSSSETVVIKETQTAFIIMLVISIILSSLMGWLLSAISDNDPLLWLLFIIFVLIGVFSLAFKKRSQSEMIILTSTTIGGVGFKHPYPLHNIVDFNFMSFNGSRILTLEFANNVDYPEIEFKKFSGGFSLKKKKNRMACNFISSLKANNERLSDKEFINMLHEYLQAAHARHALNQIQSD